MISQPALLSTLLFAEHAALASSGHSDRPDSYSLFSPHLEVLISLTYWQSGLRALYSQQDADRFLLHVANGMLSLRRVTLMLLTVLRSLVSRNIRIPMNYDAGSAKAVEGCGGSVKGYEGLTESLWRVKKASQPVSHAILRLDQWRVNECTTQIPCFTIPVSLPPQLLFALHEGGCEVEEAILEAEPLKYCLLFFSYWVACCASAGRPLR